MMKQNGSTLLEILIAMSIFSLVMLSLAHLQWVSILHFQKAYEVIKATQSKDKTLQEANKPPK